MSISSISGYGVDYSLVDILAAESNAESTETDASQSLVEKTKAVVAQSKARSAYGSSMTSGAGQAALKRALSEIEPNANGNISFDMIREHRGKLEEELSVVIGAGLIMEGVNPDTEFALVASSQGEISVSCNDQVEKEKIEKFLQENPKVGEQFLYVQALGNLERAQNSSASVRNWESMRNSKAELQSQSIEMFFAAAQESGLGYASLLGDFSGGESNYFMGANVMV